MIKYKHKPSGDWVEESNDHYYVLQSDGRPIPRHLIENCSDWEVYVKTSTPTTAEEFNEKYKDYLGKGHYGLDLGHPEAIKYLDEEFQTLTKIEGFKYSQIKSKFNSFRFYADNLPEGKSIEIEKNLYKIYNPEPKPQPKDRRLIVSRIQTPDGTILTSYHRHDYVIHLDKNGEEYMLDGGNDYQRRSVNKVPATDLSVYSDAPFEVIREVFCRGGRGKDGKQPLTWVPMSKMSNSWLEACIVYNEERGMGESFASQMYEKELDYRKENNIVIED